MSTRPSLGIDEWYHCYNRGVDKRKVFGTVGDYERFLSLMFLCNGSKRLHVSDFQTRSFNNLLDTSLDRGAPIVEIGSWCLMPNHVHLLLKEVRKGGIALFMQKVFTGYTMYFNKKYERTGSLFAGSFKSKHVDDDRYLKQLISYIHMNPIELHFPDWEMGRVSVRKAAASLEAYRYSSLHAFENERHKERLLMGGSVFEIFDTVPKRERMLSDARGYFLEHRGAT